MLGEVERQIVNTTDAPRAIGPYSQAVISGNFVFTARQSPTCPTVNTKFPEITA
mgnify:CR=1 FL=1